MEGKSLKVSGLTVRRSWRYIYFIIAGSNFIPIVTGLISIPSDRSRKREENRQVDWLGAGLITVGLSLLLFAVTQAGMESDGWRTPCELAPAVRMDDPLITTQTFPPSSLSLSF